MKRTRIVSLLCLIVVSCTTRQATSVADPTIAAKPRSTGTPTSASIPEATATGALMADGILMLSPNHYKFLIWSVSFSLPKNWDINNKYYLSPVGTGSSLDAGRQAYIFYRNSIIDSDSKSEYPRIAILFETIPGEVDVKTYSEDTLAKGHGANIVIDQILDPRELGLSIDTALAYKSSYIFESVEYTQYVIHVVYETTGIEIIMDSQTEMFANFDSEFLYFLKELTFG
ncbi:MAG: hypothetical protein WCC12_00785 [Anaerolineales bacterium]